MTELDSVHSDDQHGTQTQARLDTEWTLLTALRETIGIARGTLPTYSESFAIATTLAPQIFNSNDSLLMRQQESATARRFRQVAVARSAKSRREIGPLEVLDEEISQYEAALEATSERDELRKHLGTLYVARREIALDSMTENETIFRDVDQVQRSMPVSSRGKDYKQYVLPNDRIFRIRVLHPNPPEHSLGADLIYEHYWDDRELVRIVALQYKIWDRGVLYDEKRMSEQLQKLENALCNNTVCERYDASKKYRLPNCSAFLRPTDKLQRPDSSLISSGLHIPLCVLKRSWQDTGRGGRKISKEAVQDEAISHHIFEEMFHSNMLGSRWLKYEELENIYKEHQLLSTHERMVLHAQSFAK